MKIIFTIIILLIFTSIILGAYTKGRPGEHNLHLLYPLLLVDIMLLLLSPIFLIANIASLFSKNDNYTSPLYLSISIFALLYALYKCVLFFA